MTDLRAPDDWSPAQRARLHKAIARAIERTAANIQRPGLAIEIVSTAPENLTRSGPRPAVRADVARLPGEAERDGLAGQAQW